MQRLVLFYQKRGSWFFLAGLVMSCFAVYFSSSVWLFVLLGLGLALFLSDIVILTLGSGGDPRKLERAYLIAFGLGVAALVAFFVRYNITVPVTTTAGEASFLPRLRLALLFLFLLTLIGGTIYRFMIGLSFVARSDASTPLHQKRAEYRRNALLSILAVIPVLILMNYAVTLRNPILDFPQTYTLGEQSRTIISSLRGRVDVYVFLPEAQWVQKRDAAIRNTEIGRMESEIRLMLDQLPLVNSDINLHYLNADLESFDTQEFGVVTNGTIVIRAPRTEAVGLEEKPYVERRVFVYSASDLKKLEKNLTRALVHVSSPQITIYYTNLNGERFGFTHPSQATGGLQTLRNQLLFYNATLRPLDRSNDWPGPVPDDADVVMIMAPTVRFAAEARDHLKDYIMQGGNVLICLDPTAPVDFGWLTEEFGGAKAYDLERGPLMNTIYRDLLATDNFGDHRITESLSAGGRVGVLFPNHGYFVERLLESSTPGTEEAPDVAPQLSSLSDISAESFIYAPHDSFVDSNRNGRKDDGETTGRVSVGVAFSQKFNPESPRIAIYSGVDWVTERGLRLPFPNQNITLMVDTIMWMTENPLASAIVPDEPTDETIQMTDALKLRLMILGLIGFPVLISAIFGFAVYWYRRSRRFTGDS